MGEMIEFKRPDGKICPGYLAPPKAGSSAPGFVVIQEWWGLNDQIKKTADRLAEAGYRALVPDFYRGKVTKAADEANHLMTNLNFPDAAGQDIRGAVHLKQSSKKVAVGGFCMGGALTILSAVRVPEMDAGACFYGIPPLDAADRLLLGHSRRLQQRHRPPQLHLRQQRHQLSRLPPSATMKVGPAPAASASSGRNNLEPV